MRIRPRSLLYALALVATAAAAAPAAAASAVCDAIQTPATFRGEVPTAQQVLGFELGSQEVTSAEANAYLAAVDATSDRVITGTLGYSVEGRPLKYAIVGRPENVTATGLATVREAARTLRDSQTSDAEAASLAETSPAILWDGANVHGNEESGTDASLRVLYELADRSDCAAQRILDNAIVIIVPVQNPDGREADTRRNAYLFDMNRDWFARTQPEIDSQLELMRQYPPVLVIDAHEMGSSYYFFPPNADPVYHEVTDEALHWINDLYGAAMAAEFDRQGIRYFNGEPYDLFGVYFGDTVPANGFLSAGMTFEKANGDPIAQRTYEQYVTQWVSLSQAAIHKQSILREWHDAHVEAVQQGEAGILEPNQILDPRNGIGMTVPTDPVRHYFLRTDDPNKSGAVQSLVRRLQRMDVAVYRLTKPLVVSDYHEYTRPATVATLPVGTYWIPLAQQQKHWVQAMLHENSYPPVGFVYDVSAWSQPLLFNVPGGYSGATVAPTATRVRLLSEPAPLAVPKKGPVVGIYRISNATSAYESTGWLRWLFDNVWHVPYREIGPSGVRASTLAGIDVLLVPNGGAQGALWYLGVTGKRALVDWVNAGGRWVSWSGGTELAARLGISTVRLQAPHSDIESLVRVSVDSSSPLATGVGPHNWVLYNYSDVMTAARGAVPLRFPAYGSADFYISGFADGEQELGGTAAVVDEPVGDGRAVVFNTDPNFRAWTVGMQRVLWNAIYGADPWVGTAAAAGSAARAADETAARNAAESLPDPDPIRVSVHSRDAATTESIVRRYTSAYELSKTNGKVTFLIANPDGLTMDEHPFAADVARALADAGIKPVAFDTP